MTHDRGTGSRRGDAVHCLDDLPRAVWGCPEPLVAPGGDDAGRHQRFERRPDYERYRRPHPQGQEDASLTMNGLIDAVRFPGGPGVLGVFVPEDSGRRRVRWTAACRRGISRW
ncbi:hypothetical protein ACFY15_26940 [Streptomyces sp. NPDC001373]|uniref:hypothetical protein n=1 Tax=Streptomyces sp. NPDC001373 TaxID=3364565 RepID=UPI00369781F6